MAISRMQRISLLAPDAILDRLLLLMQELEQVEIIPLEETLSPVIEDDETLGMIDEYYDESVSKQQLTEEFSKRLHRIERTIEKIAPFVDKPSWLSRLKQGEDQVSYRQIEVHGKHFNEEEVLEEANALLNRLTTLEELITERRDQKNHLSRWRNLEITPYQLNKYKAFSGIIGTVPSTNEDSFIRHIKEDDQLWHETVFIDEHDYGVIIFSYDKDKQEILRDLRDYQFLPFKYTKRELPAQVIEQCEQEIQSASKERQEILTTLQNYQTSFKDLQWQYEYVNNLSIREKTKLSLSRSDHLVVIEGWIEAEKVEEFLAVIQQTFNQQVVVRVRDMTEEEKTEAPTKLVNNILVRPFEVLTNMYGLPNYDEIDPTPFIMPFYSFFFGMMLADLGYGIILSLIGLIGLLIVKGNQSTRDILRLILTLGISTAVWGGIYGSAFGFTIEQIQIIDLQSSVTEIMIFSMVVGIIHMMIGFGINVYLKIKDKDFAIAYAEGLHWLIVILGLGLMVLSQLVPSLTILFTLGKWLVILSFIGMFVAYVIGAASIAGLGLGLLGLINAVSYFGDVISYTRLMALGLSGVSIGAAFNLIIAQLPGVARFTIGALLFIGLHLFNLFLSAMTGVVHSLRLIFVEFFGKFYTGQGRKFEPLGLDQTYVSMKKSTLQQEDE